MIKAGCRFMVMAPTEMTTHVPEQRHMDKAYWDRRARGLDDVPHLNDLPNDSSRTARR
jgi:hypothetical protein